ncbi:MAG TPA: hypothetical protein VK463_18300 [Desulfomonilaceae bacterium]|nr:hypothetical protein [Desulfomonilaceae bacterium]
MKYRPQFGLRQCENLHSGRDLPEFLVGPFPAEALLKMAHVARDFHPSRLLADSGGPEGLSVHPLWLSGMVEYAFRLIRAKWCIVKMTIDYRAQVYESDVLRLTILAVNDSGNEQDYSFRIENPKGTAVAAGEATIALP